MIYLSVYFEFFKIGLFAIGGGLASIPFLYGMAQKHDWFASAKIPDMLAVAQLLPGAIGINLGAYAGSLAAPLGFIAAPLGMISPQIAVILVVSRIINKYRQSGAAQAVFTGIKPASCGLLAAACFFVCKAALFKPEGAGVLELIRVKECVLFAVFLAGILLLKKHPAVYIIAAAIAGIALKL